MTGDTIGDGFPRALFNYLLDSDTRRWVKDPPRFEWFGASFCGRLVFSMSFTDYNKLILCEFDNLWEFTIMFKSTEDGIITTLTGDAERFQQDITLSCIALGITA